MAPKKAKPKVKKKKWVSIIAPKSFNNVPLGETHVLDNEQVNTKSITLNLGTVLNDMRKQSYLVRFQVTSVKENKAQTALVGLSMTPSGAKRLIRRGRSKVEDSFLARLKSGQVVRIKPVVVTINRCSKPAKTSIRLAIREKLKEVLAETTLDQFVQDALSNKLSKIMKDVSNNSHPTRTADIKAIQLLPGHRTFVDEPETEPEAPAKEEKTADTPKKAAKKTTAKKTASAEEKADN